MLTSLVIGTCSHHLVLSILLFLLLLLLLVILLLLMWLCLIIILIVVLILLRSKLSMKVHILLDHTGVDWAFWYRSSLALIVLLWNLTTWLFTIRSILKVALRVFTYIWIFPLLVFILIFHFIAVYLIMIL